MIGVQPMTDEGEIEATFDLDLLKRVAADSAAHHQ
jgi:hypothetical protein